MAVMPFNLVRREDLDPTCVDVLQEARQGQTRLLDPRSVDEVVQSVRARNDLQAQRFGRRVGQQLAHGHRRNDATLVFAQGIAPSR